MLDGERNQIFEGWIQGHKAILFKVARLRRDAFGP